MVDLLPDMCGIAWVGRRHDLVVIAARVVVLNGYAAFQPKLG